MAFGDIVQEQIAGGPSGVTTLNATMSALTAGNLLIIYVGSGAADCTTTYTGAQLALDINNTTEADRQKVFYKVLGAGEATTVTVTTAGQAADELITYVAEIEGPWASAPLDLSEAEARQASGTAYVISPASATAQNDEVAVACAYTRNINNAGSWSDSFVEQLDFDAGDTGAAAKSWHVATKTLTATATVTTTLTYANTTVAMGGMATFKAAGGGAATILRHMMQYH